MAEYLVHVMREQRHIFHELFAFAKLFPLI